MYVIINADDLGNNEKGDEVTFDLMTKGKITSATLLANGSSFEEAAETLSHFSEYSFGVHLNITEFRPLTSRKKLLPLLDKNGCFQVDRIRHVKITRSLAQGIFAEFSAQIERLQSRNISISHIDSNHHIHTIPRLFPIIKSLQKKYKLRKVRISLNVYPGEKEISKTLPFKKKLFNFSLRWIYPYSITTDCFSNYLTFREKACSVVPFCRFYEIMIHPTLPHFHEETELFCTRWEDTLDFPIEMIDYNQL